MFWNERILYLQIKQGTVHAREVVSGKSITMKCEGLNHPRTLMGDFISIEACFREIVKKIAPVRFFNPAPIIVVHLMPQVDGGYTNVEIRAFREAAIGAGARKVILPKRHSPLSNAQLNSLDFEALD